MADPVSWLMIEPGWTVLDADGEKVGSVDEVAGDSSDDIFNGLSISTSMLGRPRYVESEQVAAITEGCIQLKLGRDEIARLSEYRDPPTTAQILPEEAGELRRVESAVEAPIHRRRERLNPLTRVLHAVRRLFGR
jgi:hypothetical protein